MKIKNGRKTAQLLLVLVLGIILLGGCGKAEVETKEQARDHLQNLSVSFWTDSAELFMEYPPLLAGEAAKFLIHLTILKDFSAVKKAILTIDFYLGESKILSQVEKMPARDGIFTPEIEFKSPGCYTMFLKLEGDEINETIKVDSIIVYARAEEIQSNPMETKGSISFLKEQQWKIEFSTEKAMKRTLQGSVAVTGEILAVPRNFAKVTSPFEGLISVSKNEHLLSLGSFVRKGERLLFVSPTADAGTNILSNKKEFLIAETEYERAKELYDKRAIPEKRLTESRLDFESKRASYKAVAEQIEFSDDSFILVAPIDGYIEKINFTLGDRIASGQELFAVSNPTRILLRADVPETKIIAAVETQDAFFLIDGLEQEFSTRELNGKKISVASTIDLASHTIPVFFELNNSKNLIKIGMHARIFLAVGGIRSSVAVPKSAIVDEDGTKTVYVQSTGESFEKRIVRVGTEDKGYIEIINGINESERVVTKGAYQVRLASLGVNASMGQGHVH